MSNNDLSIDIDYESNKDKWIYKDKGCSNLNTNDGCLKSLFDLVQHSHNCYSYMLNIIHPEILKECQKNIYSKTKNNNLNILKDSDRCRYMWKQPGYYANISKSEPKLEYTCPNLVEKVLKDFPNIIHVDKIKHNNNIIKCQDNTNLEKCQCPKGYRKGALVVAPGGTFHFYRKDKGNIWSHKDGSYTPSLVDSVGNRVSDPQTCNRKYSNVEYSDFCGYFCIPDNLKY